jgi:hypothetical protein
MIADDVGRRLRDVRIVIFERNKDMLSDDTIGDILRRVASPTLRFGAVTHG